MARRSRGAVASSWPAPVFALAVVTLALFWQFPARGRAYLPADLLAGVPPWRDPERVPPPPRNPASQDPIFQYYPGSARFASLLGTKGAFRWETALGCGEPLSIQPPFEADYPLARVAYRLLPAWAAHATLAALHVFLAGLGMVVWARARGSRFSSSLVAGVGYALAPWSMAWLEAPSSGVAWAALPWGLGLLERGRATRDLKLAAGAALAFGLGALGGHLQFIELGLLAAVAVTLVARPAAGERLASLRLVVASITGALLVGAARLVPAAFELAASGRGRIPFEHYLETTGSLDLRRALLLGFPDLLGNPVPSRLGEDVVSTNWIERGAQEAQANFIEMRPHVGTVVLILALVGIVAHPRSRALGVLALGAFALALQTPLVAVAWALVPGLGATTPLRFLALLPLFLGPVVASGFDALAEADPGARRRILATVFTALAVFAVVWAILASSLGPGLVAPAHAKGSLGRHALAPWLAWDGRALGRPALLALLTGLGVVRAITAPARDSRRIARALVAGLLAFDLLEAGVRLQATCRPDALYPETPAIQEVACLTSAGGRALLARDVPLDGLLPFGIPAVGVYSSAQPSRSLDLFEALEPTQPRARQWLRISPDLPPEWQRLLGVTAILTPRAGLLPSPDVALVWSATSAPGPAVFARGDASRAWLFSRSAATFVATEAEALAVCSRPGFSPLATVVLEGEAPARTAPPVDPAPATRARPVAALETDPEHVRVPVVAAGPCVLVLADNLAPGVHATLDGDPVPILPAFVAFRGVLVPAGEHVVAFEFTPPGWPLAPLVSWGTSLACVALLLTRARGRA